MYWHCLTSLPYIPGLLEEPDKGNLLKISYVDEVIGWSIILTESEKHGMCIFSVILIQKYHFMLGKVLAVARNVIYNLLNLPLTLIRQKRGHTSYSGNGQASAYQTCC